MVVASEMPLLVWDVRMAKGDKGLVGVVESAEQTVRGLIELVKRLVFVFDLRWQ